VEPVFRGVSDGSEYVRELGLGIDVVEFCRRDQRRHDRGTIPVQQAGDKSQALFHDRTGSPRQPHLLQTKGDQTAAFESRPRLLGWRVGFPQGPTCKVSS
jgi:hypothetical protein